MTCASHAVFPTRMWLTLSAASLALLATSAGRARSQPQNFQLCYAAGAREEGGAFAGGTEMRLLTAHGGKLYAGNGYWEDRPGPEGLQGPQILVLDAPGKAWRVDHTFAERMPNGRIRDLAVCALAGLPLRPAPGQRAVHPVTRRGADDHKVALPHGARCGILRRLRREQSASP
jgi:hypothetical protein